MGFLPSDYSGVPDAKSGYMRLEQGDNKFRVLSSAIVGNEFWVTNEDGGRKPVRRKTDERISPNELEINQKTGEPERIKHFWAFVVWNYNEERVQILELTQKTIQRPITSYTQDEDFGDPKGYDIIIERKGEGVETEYTTRAKPPKKLDEDIKEAYEAMEIDLEALFDSEDPFAAMSAEAVADEIKEALDK